MEFGAGSLETKEKSPGSGVRSPVINDHPKLRWPLGFLGGKSLELGVGGLETKEKSPGSGVRSPVINDHPKLRWPLGLLGGKKFGAGGLESKGLKLKDQSIVWSTEPGVWSRLNNLPSSAFGVRRLATINQFKQLSDFKN